MMATGRLRSSENYIWSLDDCICEHGNGKLYFGRHVREYRRCTIKVLNTGDDGKTMENHMREFQILKRLDHPNIIKFLALETVNDSIPDDAILVMEYCDGGSLLTLLEGPENAYGMPEKEFLCLLRDLASGLKHLMDNGIVHRGIRPENIVKDVTEDGRSVFKLVDFSTARHLEPDAEFTSLCGSPDYRFPGGSSKDSNMDRGRSRGFTACVDLWSVGVTFYQSAAGQLPFRPYGGAEENSETMMQMTKHKPAGVISAVQNSHNGPIEWSDKLPPTCSLSYGLQRLVVPLLAGLLESNPEKMLTFEVFFEEVPKLVEKLVVFVFSISKADLFNVYCNKDTGLAEFCDLLEQQTGISAQSQRLIYENRWLDGQFEALPNVNEQTTVAMFPLTSPANPVFLFSSDPQSSINPFRPFKPDAPQIVMGRNDLRKDLNSAKMFCTDLCYLRRIVSDNHLKQRSIKKAVIMFHLVLCKEISEERARIKQFGALLEEFAYRMAVIDQTHSIFRRTTARNRPSTKAERKLERYKQLTRQNMNRFRELEVEGATLDDKTDADRFLSPEWIDNSGCQEEDNSCLMRMNWIVDNAALIRNEISKKLHWGNRIQSSQKQIHEFQKQKLEQVFKRGLSVANEHCLPKSLEIYKQAMERYREFQTIYKRIHELKITAKNVSEILSLLTDNVDQLQNELNLDWQKPTEEFDRGISGFESPSLADHETRVTSECQMIGNEFVFKVPKKMFKNLEKMGVHIHLPVISDTSVPARAQRISVQSETQGTMMQATMQGTSMIQKNPIADIERTTDDALFENVAPGYEDLPETMTLSQAT